MALPLNDINNQDLEAQILKEHELFSENEQSKVDEILLREDSHVHLNSSTSYIPPLKLTYGLGSVTEADNEPVFFFDIDNCLYERSTKIHDLMQIYIHKFFKDNLKLNDEDAHRLHHRYYTQYGLAIEGLVRNHKINALDYNKLVDDALPLEKILKPNEELRKMLLSLKKNGICKRLWLFTNAYKNHGLRVVHLLGIGDLFDGITYCHYEEFPLICKPMPQMFDRALKEAGVLDKKNAYFVDDSGLNTRAAKKFGWGHVIQYVEREEDLEAVRSKSAENEGISLIRNILDIPKVCPELFQS